LCQISSQLITAPGTTDQRTADDSAPDDQHQQQQQLADDEDGHLLYSEGTVLNSRCNHRIHL